MAIWPPVIVPIQTHSSNYGISIVFFVACEVCMNATTHQTESIFLLNVKSR